MVETLRVLAQKAPPPTVLTDLYTVPTSTSTAISSIVICNQNSIDVAFRVSVAVAGAEDSIIQYLYFDLPMLANDTFTATIGMTLAATDIVRVQTDTNSVSFTLFGDEIS